MRRFVAALAVASLAALALAGSAPAAGCEPRVACFGPESVSPSLSTIQAGAHPDFTLSFAMKQDAESPENVAGVRDPYAKLRDLAIELPPGLLGDPNVLGLPQQCPAAELARGISAECPNGSQIGVTTLNLYGLDAVDGIDLRITEPLYMMVPPGGDVVARLGFVAATEPTLIDIRVRSGSDYGLTSEVLAVPPVSKLASAETTLWGVPADPVHDTERCTPREAFSGCIDSEPRPPGSRSLSFMTNPTSCGSGKGIVISAASWVLPDLFSSAGTTLPTISGCNKVPFAPAFAALPTTHRAEAPTGLDVNLKLPEAETVDALATSHLKDARVILPEGMTIAPGAADGLQACSAGQVGIGRNESAHCPPASQLGSAEFDVPALARRMKGALYQRTPEPGHLFRVWLVADDLGAHVKLAGEIELDERTGQLTSIFLDNPQVPLRELVLHLKGGPRAPLATPRSCGTHFTHWEFTPWSGTPAVKGDSPMAISEGCSNGGFSPRLSAGTVSPSAGAYSPFALHLTREDGEQNLAGLDVTLPPGLAAKFAGVSLCEGAAAQSGECPPNSRVGSVTTAAGPGSSPLWIPQPGKEPTAVYLSGPYKGAPLSFVVKVPAQAGPFDLGTVVTRAAIHVDPVTAQGTVKADPLPQILQGVPVAYRTIHVDVDRPGFTLNPTNCSEMAVRGRIASDKGAIASPSTRFQVGGCRGLDLKPRMSLRLRGGTGRGAHPRLTALLTARPGDANLAEAVVELAHTSFLDQAHIRTICTRVQFAADACPQAAAYGWVKAFTPLLEEPLQGPAYLRSSDHPLPDLVFDLHGLVDIEAVGRVNSVRGHIRVSFEEIPDAPLSKVIVEMQGGRKGLIVNSSDLCAGPARAKAEFVGQNGKSHEARPLLRNDCKGAKKRSNGKH